jgi:hypothetical protein
MPQSKIGKVKYILLKNHFLLKIFFQHIKIKQVAGLKSLQGKI